MTDENVIETVEGLDALTPGEWVIDADGDALCLVDTYLGWPQRMWMPKAKKGRVGLVLSLEHATFPVALAEIDPEYVCKHGRGTNECGHCYLCGVVVGERRERHFNAETMAVVREAGRMNAAYDEAHRSTGPVHWVGDAPTSLHGNGAASFERTTRDAAEVTCSLCLTLLDRESSEQ